MKRCCFFCQENKAGTKEHVIPQWLLRNHDLYNKTLKLPNDQSLRYCSLTVPACSTCNSGAWSALENKISIAAIQQPTDRELWLWACKIYYGVNVKDEELVWDVRKKGEKISSILKLEDPLQKARYFLRCITDLCTTSPSPFGSVFFFKFSTPQQFHFIHFFTTKSIAISAGEFGLVCFVEDGQIVKNNSTINRQYLALTQKDDTNIRDMLWFYANTHYDISRANMGYDLMLMPDQSIHLINHTFRDPNPYKESEFAIICARLGVAWIKEGQTLLSTYTVYIHQVEIPRFLNKQLKRITGYNWHIDLGQSTANLENKSVLYPKVLLMFFKNYNFEINFESNKNEFTLTLKADHLSLLCQMPTIADCVKTIPSSSAININERVATEPATASLFSVSSSSTM